MPNPVMPLTERAADRFLERFGRPPRWFAMAPGRVNLIGEHTDYNDGFVLPMAIERYTCVASAPAEGSTITVCSTAMEGELSVDIKRPLTRGFPDWTNYVRGVIAGFSRLGPMNVGCDAIIDSSVPLGGGLSSSASLQVAMATTLEAVSGRTLERAEKALLCQKAEQEFAGVPCGIMDQFTSVMAEENHLLLLDCRSRETENIPFQNPDVSVLIVDSCVKHALTGGEYALRRTQCEAAAKGMNVASLRDFTLSQLEAAQPRVGDVHFRRARHVVSEIARTRAAAEAFRASDWIRAGELMYESHASLKDDFEVSCAELDLLVEIARGFGVQRGVFGSRMTGGGFGGCTVSLVATAEVDSIRKGISKAYLQRTGLTPSVFVSRPAAGARLVE